MERFNVTNMTRLASAKMTGTLIAKKHKFYFTYEAIGARELDYILDAIWEAPGLFYPLVFDYQGVQMSKTVYSGSIPTELHRAGTNTEWVWKNVTFDLIEQ